MRNPLSASSKTSILAVLLLGAAASSFAVNIDSTYLFGKVVPGNPSSLAIEEDRLDYFIEKYNGGTPSAPDANAYTSLAGSNVPAAPLPLADGTSTGQNAGGFTSANIDVTGWEYLMVKWSNNTFYYYVGDLTGVQTIVNDVEFNSPGGPNPRPQPQNASHYRFFGARDPGTGVPDGGMTIALMGAGLAGIGFLRRRF